MKHSVGRNISRLRLSQGITQEQLAQRMDVTPQAVSKWENDLNYPDVAALPRLAALLGTSVDALLSVPDRTLDGAQAPDAAEAQATPEPLTATTAGPASGERAGSGGACAPRPALAARPAPSSDISAGPAPASTGRPRGPRSADAPASTGRHLHIEVHGPRNNVNLALPMQTIAALTAFVSAVPQVRTIVEAYDIDLEAVLATAYGALDAVGTSTLLDITDGEDRVHLYVR